MKKFLLIVALLFSTNSFAIDAYSTADEGAKNLVKQVIKVLKAPNTIETEKKIYSVIEHAFADGTIFNSYWMGYNDLSASKIKNPDVEYIEYFINTGKHGMFFFSFMYDKKANQIMVSRKQIRFGAKKDGLEVFNKQKNDTTNYEILHERDTYAMTQKKGHVDFAGFSIGSVAASVVYFDQTIIDL